MKSARTAISIGLASVAAIGILLILPSPVAADNCSSLSDCWATAAGAAAAAVAAAVAGFGGLLHGYRDSGYYNYGPTIDTSRLGQEPQGPPVPPGLYDEGFVYAGPDGTVRDQPSDDGTVVAEAPHGGRLPYDDVVRDASGTPTHYHVNVPGGPSGYIPAADTYDTRPPTPYIPPRPIPQLDRDIGQSDLADATSAQTAGTRG